MRKKLIAKDNKGNRAYIDTDGKVMVVNKKGELYNPTFTKSFLRSAGYKVRKIGGKTVIDYWM